MHPAVLNVFDDICRKHLVNGSVLEIGATPDASTLLNLPSLSGAKKKIGINKVGASTFNGFEIRNVDANEMACFETGFFDAVLCNAVLEHDPFFWKTLAEIRRVTRCGGLIAIGTPGYSQLPSERKWHRFFSKLKWCAPGRDGWALEHSTLTLAVHNFPGDYYRFSEQTFCDVFFEGMKNVTVQTVLTPPRIIGFGFRE